MIPALHSIDSLLNKFDELSKCHETFLSNFDTNFSDIKNPLRNVARTEDEQRKTENILSNVNENDERFDLIGPLEDFHRRTIKSRHLRRPPCYLRNNTSLTHRVPTKPPSITVESPSLPKISLITTKANIHQPEIPTPNKNIIEQKIDFTTKNKLKVIPHHLPSPQQDARGNITTFTMETINRLSKPRRYNRIPDQIPSIKYVKQRPKFYGNIKKEASRCTTLPPIKQTKTTNTKPSLKKLKPENRIPTQMSKRNPVTYVSHSFVFVAPPPTIRLVFSTQQQKPFRVVNLPKILPATKKFIIHLKI